MEKLIQKLEELGFNARVSEDRKIMRLSRDVDSYILTLSDNGGTWHMVHTINDTIFHSETFFDVKGLGYYILKQKQDREFVN